jgi:hypothetical protein
MKKHRKNVSYGSSPTIERKSVFSGTMKTGEGGEEGGARQNMSFTWKNICA